MVVYPVLCVEEVKKKETAFYLLEDKMVSSIYMAMQAIIIVGYILCVGFRLLVSAMRCSFAQSYLCLFHEEVFWITSINLK